MMIPWRVPDDTLPVPLEDYVAAHLGLDRRPVRAWIRAGRVTVDGLPGKLRRWVRPGQEIRVDPLPPQPHAAVPEDLDLPIRYVDRHLVVVAKPAGMATHPSPGWWRGSCVNALLFAIQDWPGIGGVAGPGIVHRLDRDTSGLLVFAKTDQIHKALLADMRARRIQREYLAWVEGKLAGSGTIAAPLGRDVGNPYQEAVRPDGKPAVTHYQVLKEGLERSQVSLQLETGRTHQIRVHMAHLGHPVWGDPLYGRGRPLMALHSNHLAFRHPVMGEDMVFNEPVPASWAGLD